MVDFEVKIVGENPEVRVTVPLDNYLLDEEGINSAKEKIECKSI